MIESRFDNEGNYNRFKFDPLRAIKQRFHQCAHLADVEGILKCFEEDEAANIDKAREIMLHQGSHNYNAAMIAAWGDPPNCETPQEKMRKQLTAIKTILDKACELGVFKRILAQTNFADNANMVMIFATIGGAKMPFLKIPLAYCYDPEDLAELLAVRDSKDPPSSPGNFFSGAEVPDGNPVELARLNEVRDTEVLLTDPDCWKICREFYREYFGAGDPPSNKYRSEQIEDYVYGSAQKSAFERKNYKAGMSLQEKYEVEKSERKRLEEEVKMLKMRIAYDDHMRNT